MFKKKLVGLLSIPLLASSLFLNGCSFALTLDQKIQQTFKKYMSDVEGIVGCGVVDIQTGEIIARQVFNPELLRGKKEMLPAFITNIVRAINHNLKKLNYSVNWVSIRFNKGVILIKQLDEDTFMGCFFKPNVNIMEARIIFLKFVAPEVEKLLNQ